MNNIAQRLATMELHARVRATARMVYRPSGIEIAQGTRGTIREVTHGGQLVAVEWDGLAKSIWTPYDHLEVLPS